MPGPTRPRLGMPTSRDSLLRLLRRLPDPQIGELPVLGVDDFALRRGHVYGTVVIDMLTGRPVDLLPDRETATLAAWLREHPGVEVICRDRAGAYAEAARLGAPGAVQVADRWHLWRNLGQAVEKTVTTRRSSSPPPTTAGAATGRTPEDRTPAAGGRSPAGEEDRHPDAGTARCGARALRAGPVQGGDRHASWACTRPRSASSPAPATVEELIAKTEQRAHLVDDHLEHLHRRWNEGERNATGLFRRSPSSATRAENWPCSATCAASATDEVTPRSRARNHPPSARSPAGS